MDYTPFRMHRRYERVTAITPEEFHRRWAQTREMMNREGLDALVCLFPARFGCGLWLAGEREASAVLLPKEGAVQVAFDGLLDVGGHWMLPDGRWLEPPADEGIRLLPHLDVADVPVRRVGLVHSADASGHSLRALRELFPQVEWTDASLAFDRVKAVKSPFELSLSEDTSRMLEKALSQFPLLCRRGRLYKDVCDDMQHLVAGLGCPGDYMITMLHVFDLNGRSLTPLKQPLPGMRVQDGHMIAYLLETNGESGMYGVLCRLFALGEPSAEFQRMYDLCVRGNRLAGSLMRPGVTCREIAAFIREYYRLNGYQTDDACFMHNMGYTCYEPPNPNDDSHWPTPSETADDPLVAGHQLHCHPHVWFREGFTSRSKVVRQINLYTVTPEGGVRAEHMTDEIIRL